MAVLHKEFIKFDKEITLNSSRKESLSNSRKEIRRKIRKWFKDNKPDEIQPKFHGQGSYEMNTTINPIVEYDSDNNIIRKYDLDYGIYFIEKDGEDKKQSIDTWHNWVYNSVEDHTNKKPIKKTTCIRVVFSDGRHIDLPIYYKQGDTIELAHKSKGWLLSDPKAFYEWFNEEKKTKPRLEAIVRCLKAWKNYKENNNSSLKLPSGFELTILSVNHYVDADNLDEAFRETVIAIDSELNKINGFKCLRPTTPKGENVFAGYSDTRKTGFLNALNSLKLDCEKASNEDNFENASEILRANQFGSRFPKGENKRESERNHALANSMAAAKITPKPYAD